MLGGTGDDVFVFTDTSDSARTVDAADVIVDFVHGADRINLSSIDADTTVTGNGKFTLIDGAAFTDEGQVRFTTNANHETVIELNTGGSLAADMVIVLSGTIALAKEDFVL